LRSGSGQVAQVVERSPEKAGVGGSTPSLATINLKNLVAQSRNSQPTIQPTIRSSDHRFLTEPLDLALAAPKPGTVLSRWLCGEIRVAILDGRLKRGTRLPSTRELARRYRLSRGTVVTAFERLHSEGYLEGAVGAGTQVNTLLPEDLLHAKRTTDKVSPVSKSRPVLSEYARRLMSFPEI
jgi:DNA-binding transcriptional regulator YhcF (GntR family)